MIIGFTAQMHSGKDVCCDHIVESNKGELTFVKRGFATPIKDTCKILFGLTHNQLYGSEKETVDPRLGVTPRRIMQYFGTDIVRDIISPKLLGRPAGTFWVDYMDKWWKDQGCPRLVINDVRFQEEVDFINRVGGTVVRIIRPEFTVSLPTHSSEQVDGLRDVGHTIINNGTLNDMCLKVDNLVRSILLKE